MEAAGGQQWVNAARWRPGGVYGTRARTLRMRGFKEAPSVVHDGDSKASGGAGMGKGVAAGLAGGADTLPAWRRMLPGAACARKSPLA